MDAFFASVEVLDDPILAGKPVIVGGTGARGVVASCTYEARAYGIHSAMSSYEARRLCPHAVFVAGRYDRYVGISERLNSILLRFTPSIEPVALDEAFLDVSGVRRSIGPPHLIARGIRDAVREELGLSCCVGVARTKLLAKLASRAAKPVATAGAARPGRGVVTVPPSEELSFLHPLPVRSLWGVGPATARRLEELGVITVGDLARVPEEALCRLLGTSSGRHLATMARGEDDRPVQTRQEPKSVGHEETFASDLRDRKDLHRHLVRMADAVASHLLEAGLRGRTVNVKVRYAERSTITRSQTLAAPTCSARAIAAVAGALLDAVDVNLGVRLLGVSSSVLARAVPVGRQLSFEASFGDTSDRPEAVEPRVPSRDTVLEVEAAWDEVEAAVSQIRQRYGRSSVGPAVLVGPDGLSVKRRGDGKWGPAEASAGAASVSGRAQRGRRPSSGVSKDRRS
jgi:DNA polymerase IV